MSYSGSEGKPVFLGTLLSALDSSGELPPAFEELRVRYDTVRAHYDAGELSEDRLAGLLSGMRCYDGRGDAWTIGATSGLWYRLTEEGWMQSPPPYRQAAANEAAEMLYGASPSTQADLAEEPQPAGLSEEASPDPVGESYLAEAELLDGDPGVRDDGQDTSWEFSPDIPDAAPDGTGRTFDPGHTFAGSSESAGEVPHAGGMSVTPSSDEGWPSHGYGDPSFDPSPPATYEDGPASPAETHSAPEDSSRMIFGLPEQLFEESAGEPGLLPYGTLPDLEATPDSVYSSEDSLHGEGYGEGDRGAPGMFPAPRQDS